MATDYKLDANGDLAIENGDYVLIDGVEQVKQAWYQRMRTFKNEWFADTEIGVPYFTDVFAKGTSRAKLKNIFTEATLAVPGIVRVIDVVIGDIEPSTRFVSLKITAQVETDDGIQNETFVFSEDTPVSSIISSTFPISLGDLRVWFDAQYVDGLTNQPGAGILRLMNRAGVGEANGEGLVSIPTWDQNSPLNLKPAIFINNTDTDTDYRLLRFADTAALLDSPQAISAFLVCKPENALIQQALVQILGVEAVQNRRTAFTAGFLPPGAGSLDVVATEDIAGLSAFAARPYAPADPNVPTIFGWVKKTSGVVEMYIDGVSIGSTGSLFGLKTLGSGFIGASKSIPDLPPVQEDPDLQSSYHFYNDGTAKAINAAYGNLVVDGNAEKRGLDVLIDGDMEAVGIGAWTPGSGAVVTKETADPHSGSQYMRVAHGGVSNPYALQTVLSSSDVYTIRGWVRSDGAAIPRIYIGSNFVDYPASPGWTFVEFTDLAGSTTIALRAITSVAGYVDFDDFEVVKQTGTGGACENWTSYNAALLSKQDNGVSNQCLRVQHNGTANPAAYQTAGTLGSTFRVQGYARGDGSGAYPRLTYGSAGAPIWEGTTSNDWQSFDVVVPGLTSVNLLLWSIGTSGYCEFDSVRVYELSGGDPVNGPNATPANAPANAFNPYGRGLALDGDDQYADAGTGYEFLATNAKTFTGWIKPTAAAHTQTLWSNGGSGTDEQSLKLSGSTLTYSSGGFSASASVTLDAWVYVSTEQFPEPFRKVTTQIYLNGVLTGTTTVDGVLPTPVSTQMYFGIDDPAGGTIALREPWAGEICNFSFFVGLKSDAWLERDFVRARDQLVEFFTGYFGELLVYNGELSALDIERLDLFLKQKWGF